MGTPCPTHRSLLQGCLLQGVMYVWYLTKLPRSSRPTTRRKRGRLMSLVGFLVASSKCESNSHRKVSSAQQRTACPKRFHGRGRYATCAVPYPSFELSIWLPTCVWACMPPSVCRFRDLFYACLFFSPSAYSCLPACVSLSIVAVSFDT